MRRCVCITKNVSSFPGGLHSTVVTPYRPSGQSASIFRAGNYKTFRLPDTPFIYTFTRNVHRHLAFYNGINPCTQQSSAFCPIHSISSFLAFLRWKLLHAVVQQWPLGRNVFRNTQWWWQDFSICDFCCDLLRGDQRLWASGHTGWLAQEHSWQRIHYCIVVGSRRLMPPDALQPKAYCTNTGL